MNAQRLQLIVNGLVLTPGAPAAAALDILVQDGRIRELLPRGTPAPADAELIDAHDRLIVPGLVNAHTHAHGGLGKGAVGDRLPLEVFLTGSAALNGSRTRDDKYLSAQLSAVEMVRKGCTAAYDLFVEFPLPSVEGMNAVASAYQDVGMRAVIAPMIADRTLYQAYPGLIESLPKDLGDSARRAATAPYAETLRACREIFDDWSFDRDQIRPALGPTIPMHCSDEFLGGCRELADEFGLGIQTHLAESATQAVMAKQRYGKSLTAHLADLGLLNARFSGAHAIWIDGDDMRRLADAGASVAHNPLSNLRLGSGVAAVREMLDCGLAVGIGTDAANTSDTQNMFEASRLAAYLSRIRGPQYQDWVSAEESFTLATAGSARVLGFADQLGAIVPGAFADLVLLDLAHINYVPLRDALLQLVNGENGSAIDAVMVGGRFILRGGKLLTIDEEKLRRDAESARDRLDGANAEARRIAHSLEHWVGEFCVAHGCRHQGPHRHLRTERDLSSQKSSQ
ncbi:amidohydrolase family protein [Lacisediminimonas sp.]|uniref:amidohydrolase family protein n=1 Tax=Lacisediminimonas sp. TaxID=3060582 RepID=UPI002722BC56|nr:amidohydrolase family protein [Lacisediminimonas sp.]MDO8299557.1 amidohydrolase family protein [Lacisediminimonas sp.]